MRELIIPDTTSFTRIPMSENDIRQGQCLGLSNRNLIQNKRANLAEEIISSTYKYDINNPHQYGVELAYLQGQLDALTALINESDDANNFIVSNSIDQ